MKFHSLEVVDRVSETQRQVSEISTKLFRFDKIGDQMFSNFTVMRHILLTKM